MQSCFGTLFLTFIRSHFKSLLLSASKMVPPAYLVTDVSSPNLYSSDSSWAHHSSNNVTFFHPLLFNLSVLFNIFSYLIALARYYSSKLVRNRHKRYPYFVPDLKWNTFHALVFSTMFAVGLGECLLSNKWSSLFFLILLRTYFYYYEWLLDVSSILFCNYYNSNIAFFALHLLMWWIISIHFSNIKISLHLRNKFILVLSVFHSLVAVMSRVLRWPQDCWPLVHTTCIIPSLVWAGQVNMVNSYSFQYVTLYKTPSVKNGQRFPY